MTVFLQRWLRQGARVRRFDRWLGWLLLVALAGCWPALAQETRPPDYRVKAAFLYNFGKFVEWPSTAFADPHAPLVIGILGGDPFRGDCERIVANKNINGHPIVVRQISLSAGARPEPVYAELKRCHILFINTSGTGDLPDLLNALRGAGVLTVTDKLERFNDSGVMINFVVEHESVRFAINDDAARRAGLKISSKLLALRTNKPSP